MVILLVGSLSACEESGRVTSTNAADAAKAVKIVEGACEDFLGFYLQPQDSMTRVAEASASQTSRASQLDHKWDALAKRMTEWALDVRDIAGGIPLGDQGAERSLANGQAVAEQCRAILHIEVVDSPATS